MVNLEKLRRLWYARGHRPAEDSIMFSERLDLEWKYREAVVREKWRVRLLEFQEGNQILHQSQNRALIQQTRREQTPRPKGVIVTNWSDEAQFELAKRINCCPQCGGRLRVVAPNSQECDQGHGRMYITDSTEGLPIAVFEPYGMD
jgi:hypothetical protein